MSTRSDLLKQLIQFRGSLSGIVNQLRQFGWDSPKELTELHRTDISSVLNRYLQSQLTSTNVEEWANAVEGREDINYEPKYSDLIVSTIHELANPLLTQPLNMQRANELLNRLHKSWR